MGIEGVSRMGENKRTADRERAFEDIVNEKYVDKRKKPICTLLRSKRFVG